MPFLKWQRYITHHTNQFFFPSPFFFQNARRPHSLWWGEKAEMSFLYLFVTSVALCYVLVWESHRNCEYWIHLAKPVLESFFFFSLLMLEWEARMQRFLKGVGPCSCHLLPSLQFYEEWSDTPWGASSGLTGALHKSPYTSAGADKTCSRRHGAGCPTCRSVRHQAVKPATMSQSKPWVHVCFELCKGKYFLGRQTILQFFPGKHDFLIQPSAGKLRTPSSEC